MSAFVRKHPFLTYYVLGWIIASFVVWVTSTWGAHSPAADPLSYWHWAQAHHVMINAITVAAFGFTAGGPFVLFGLFFFPTAPSISALITSGTAWGKAGTMRLLSRFKPWRQGVTRRQGLRVYGILFAIYLVLLGAFLVFLWAHGTAEEKAQTYGALGGSFLIGFLIAIIAPFVDEGGLFEELGWRGFALPYLQTRFRVPLVAAIVLGVAWWAWHLPRELPFIFSGHNWLGGGFQLGQWLMSESLFCSYTIVLSIVIAYCFNLTGGSVWPAILIHGGTNVWSKTGATAPLWTMMKPIDLRLVILFVFVVIILIVAGPRLGLRSDADGIDPTVTPAPASA